MNQEPGDISGQPLAAAEIQIEQLLCEAYAAPAMPRSLRKRLESAVAQEWRISPALLREEPGPILRISQRGLRSWKSWPIAASVALALTLAFALRGDARAYGWAAMIDALRRQPVVQIDGREAREGVRWLSLDEKLLGEEAGGASWLFDFGRRVLLERRTSEAQVRRGRWNEATAAAEPSPLVISLLLGGPQVDSAGPRLPNLRVVEESATRRGDSVELQATLRGDNASSDVKLAIALDPETSLPRSARVDSEQGADVELAFSYPASRPEELRRRSFPADMPIVDVGLSVIAAEIAAAAAGSEEATGETPLRSAPAVAASAAGATTTTKTGAGANVSPAPQLAGAASLGWTPVAATDLSDEEAVRRIDVTLEKLWREKGIEPAVPATDEELIRRAYLDLAGRTPTVNEVRSYLNDPSPDRYRALVDRLLASRDHATHLAAVWRTFLLPEGVDVSRFGGVQAFEAWLSERFAANAPYDRVVRELLLAEGRLAKSGPLVFYAALKLDADQLAARTARVFLGMRLECAQCHDDPFEPWTQRDFWSYAAFFARISRPQAKLETVSTVMQVRDVDRGEVKLPDSEMIVPPQFLDGTAVDESPEAEARRRQLAEWLAGPGNPYFARAAANRVWALLLGRGIVDPVDGFGKRNPPRSPELLDLLAGQLVRNQFDLRRLFRMVVLSRAYRLSSGAQRADENRPEWFAQMNVKMLSPEQLYDCITVASMLVATETEGFSVARIGNSQRDAFLQEFRTVSASATEYQGGIPQALTLMNGGLIAEATDLVGGGLLKSLEAPFFSDDERIEVLYLAALSRRPSAAEWNVLRRHVASRASGVSVQEPLADILWAILNSAEFAMNH